MAAKKRKDFKARTSDNEMKAIITIRKALDALDAQAKSRVLVYLIDRARQDHEDGAKALVGKAARLGEGTANVRETEPEPEPPPQVPDEPQPEPVHA